MIVTDENKLRMACVDVLPEEYPDLKNQLEIELRRSGELGRPGIGLAAPQIGIAKNMAIVRISEKYSVDLVNCNIKNKYDKFLFKNEGCLSFPDMYEDTFRYHEIEIVNNLVSPYNFICKGLLAVVCQHELDHLVGQLLPDLKVGKKI